MRNRFRCNRELVEFKKWLETRPETNAPKLEINDSTFQQLDAQEDLFWEQIRQRIAGGESCDINIYNPIDGYGKASNLLIFDDHSDLSKHNLTVNWYIGGNTIEIKNAGIVKIALRSKSGGHVRFSKCRIDELIIGIGLGTAEIHIDLKNCWIGKLSFDRGSVGHLYISGGGLLAIDCPSPENYVVFSRDVVIRDDVYLPKEDGVYKGIKIGFQPWSNAREQLAKLGNINAASKFHSVQLRLERPLLPISLQIVSWVYGFFSDFGNSIVRPFGWLFTLWSASALVAWCFRTAQPAVDACASGFCLPAPEPELFDRLWLALLLATKPVLSPLSVSGTEVAGNTLGPGGMLLELLYRLGILVMLLFIGIALRRRFRVA